MKYDGIIIGFGKGGKTLAGALAKSGQKVAIIEKSKKMYGGTCINIGCLPSKNLVKSADKISEMDVDFKRTSELFHDAITEKMGMVKMLNGKNFKKLDSMENVDVIDGFGSFIDAHTVKVETEDGDIILEADKNLYKYRCIYQHS